MKVFIILILFLWSISFVQAIDISYSYTPHLVCNYSNNLNIQYLAINQQFGFLISSNETILAGQYFNINGKNVYGLSIGLIILRDSLNRFFADNFYVYTATGFYDTSKATEFFTEANYPDILLGFIFNKNHILYGISYSYFSSLKLHIGYSF